MSEDYPYDEEIEDNSHARNEWKPRLYNEWAPSTDPVIEECACDRTGSLVRIVTYPRTGGMEIRCDDYDLNRCDLMDRSPIQCRLAIRRIDDYALD